MVYAVTHVAEHIEVALFLTPDVLSGHREEPADDTACCDRVR